MENREKQILSEIKVLMNSVRIQLEQLDAKMAELQQVYDPQEFDTEPIDIELEGYAFAAEDDLPFVVEDQEDMPQPEPAAEPEPVVEAESLAGQEPEEEPEAEPEPLFMAFEDMPEVVEEDEPHSERQTAVIDVMATRHAWRTDMPGSPVKDIRAAIALVDRALFINSLFAENAMAFLETLNHINQVSSLDEAVDYLAAAHPEWDFDSDVVYRFMMAVRRKIN